MFRLLSNLFAGALALGASLATAHDAWVQTNTPLVRAGDAVHIDLMLGNHGNDHRDFKLASKVDPSGSSSVVVAPQGKSYDLADRWIDLGYAPREGFHSARFVAGEPGLYIVAHASDRIVQHGQPERSIKSAKTCFVVTASLDQPPLGSPGFDQPLGHPLEIVPVSHPVTPMGPGQVLRVKVLFRGQPLPAARVSFIPRGETLAAGFDARYERRTDAQGQAEFTPTEGNYYLVAVHHVRPEESSADYVQTKYGATLTVLVPQVCPCCGD